MSLKLSELKALHDKGLALIYLEPKSKKPFERKWTTAKPKSWDELENSFEKSYNVGVRLGEPSQLKNGNYLGAIDCDVKSGTRKALKEMKAKLRELGIDLESAPIVMSGRGNGSRHVYVQTKEPMRAMSFVKSENMVKVLMPGEDRPHSKKEMGELSDEERRKGYRIRAAWEISFMGTGQQTVLPPSVHPDTGFHYEWSSPFTAKFCPTFDQHKFNSQSVRRIGPGLQPQLSRDGEARKPFRAVEVDLYASGLDISTIKKIVDGLGVEDRSAELLSIAMKMCRKGFTDDQMLSVFSDKSNWISGAAYEHTKSDSRARAVAWLYNYTLVKARYGTHPLRLFEREDYSSLPRLSVEKKERIKKEIENEKNWREDLQRTEKGGFKPSLTNIELIMSNVGGENIFVHDEFSTRDSYGITAPWGGRKNDSLNDIDIIKIRRWLSGSAFGIEPGKDITLDGVRLIADRNRSHPVREWLRALKWDGKPRINTWIRDYLKGRAPEPYLSEISRTFLMAMVKRIFEPGCQWDYTLVLEGDQGTYKSSTARALAGDAWFMDNLPDLRDKDVMLNLQGKWVIELGELADVKRGDYNLVKAYLNRRVDTVRSPYDRLKQDIPRQSVFIGTVNEGEYLKDPTGNRRFWPVKVGMCDVEGIKRDREQFFAEAVFIYESFFDGKLMLSKEANKQASEMQEDRRVTDESTEMEEKLFEFVEKEMEKSKKERFNFFEFKMQQLFNLMDCWSKWDGQKFMQQIGSQVLHRNGFIRKKMNGQRVWKHLSKRGSPLSEMIQMGRWGNIL